MHHKSVLHKQKCTKKYALWHETFAFGKKKGKKQLAEAARGIVVRDDIEYYSPDIVPLFAFGLVYWRMVRMVVNLINQSNL